MWNLLCPLWVCSTGYFR
ncbi:Inhibitor of nuclear factor kappa-B kinase epsilon subunit-like protein 1 [Bienertia sinuspersici]